MSLLATSSQFDSCCGGGSTSSTSSEFTQNPTVYYDVTLGTPTDQGIVPAYPELPATAFEVNGNGSLYVWNITSRTWK